MPVRLRRGLSRRYCSTDVHAFLLIFAVQLSPLQQGLALLEQGRPADAIPFLRNAPQDDAIGWKALGVAHARLNQYDLAEPAFARACQLAPQLSDACYFQARALYALNRFEASLQALHQAPLTPPTLLAKGQALEALGRIDEAEAAMRTANTADANIALGLLFLRSGRSAQAELTLTKVVATSPDSVDAHLTLARTLMERNAINKAVPHLERAVALAPQSAQAHLLLAKAYMRSGRQRDAEAHFEAAAKGVQQ